MPRGLLGRFLLLVVTAGCAAQKQVVVQPVGYPPFFPTRPANVFAPSQIFEIQALENGGDLSQLQRKRLFDLYTLEMKSLKSGSSRHQFLASNIQRLKSAADPFERELAEIKEEVSRFKDPVQVDDRGSAVFVHKSLKREYLDAVRLWNRDQNAAALAKVNKVLANPSQQKLAKQAEWTKLHLVALRIALDMGALSDAEGVYQRLKAFDDCGPDTTLAAFLVSLHLFGNGNVAKATELFDGQCDPDKSPANQIRRIYWKARFREHPNAKPGAVAVSPDKKFSDRSGAEASLYEELFNTRVPGYYFYLAKSRLNQPLVFPSNAFGPPSHLGISLSLPSSVKALVSEAQERIQNNLRRDAAIYLQKAARLLRQDLNGENLQALLYVAHLMQAAGATLDAMKVYTVVTTELQENKPATANVQVDFLGEMFPKPHAPLVETLARQWSVDPDFIYSIMRQESAFNPGAVSVADARGLMQLMPQLARSLSSLWSYQPYYSDRLLFQAEENLKFAVYHLHQLRPIMPHYALQAASYNAGAARVNGWWKRYAGFPLDVFVELIPITETRNYVKLVLRNYVHYKALRNNGTVEPGSIPFELPPPRLVTP